MMKRCINASHKLVYSKKTYYLKQTLAKPNTPDPHLMLFLGLGKIRINSQYFLKWTNANPMKIFSRGATQRAKFAKKVHKPLLWGNVINFKLNGFNALIMVPWSASDPKKL